MQILDIYLPTEADQTLKLFSSRQQDDYWHQITWPSTGRIAK